MQDLFEEHTNYPSKSSNRRVFMKRMATVAAASTLPATLLAACGTSAPAASSTGGTTEVTFTFLTYSDISQRVQAVQSAINAAPAMKAKNLAIKLDPIDAGAYDQKMTLRFASGQPYDACFTASWTNNFYNNVAHGDLLALDDLLPKYAPKLASSMPASVFAAGRVNGKLYGIPNQQLFPKYWGAILRKDLATKYSIDLTTAKTFSDLTPILALLKEKEPGITPIYSDNLYGGSIYNPEVHGFDEIAPGVAIKYNDTGMTVFNEYATPEFLQDCQLMRQWYNAGYYVKNPQSSSDAQAAYRAGKFGFVFDQARPEEPGKFKATYGYDEVQQLLIQPFLNTTAINSGLVGVFQSTQHAQQTLELLEILNMDKTVYNLLCHGVEGIDYKLVDPSIGYISVPAESKYDPSTDWEFGNQFNGYYTNQAEAQAHVWDTSLKLNQNAATSVALGFAFDPTNTKTQVAQVTAAITQYERPVSKGLIDPISGVAQLLSALKQAGINDLMQEAQKQLNAWQAKK